MAEPQETHRIGYLQGGLWLLAGLGLYAGFRWRYPGYFDLGWRVQLLALGGVLLLSVAPPLRNALADRLRPLRSLSPPRRVAIAVFAGVLTLAYLWGSAIIHQRDLTPHSHDECSYLLQARMLAQGRLWAPTPPMSPFFETFHVLLEPVYASIYFPGTALLYVPGVWLGIPSYVTAMLVCASVAGMLCLVVTELLDDGALGLLSPLILLGNQAFRKQSTIVLSQPVLMLAALLAIWMWLRWRTVIGTRSGKTWAVALGATLGWSAIVRPIDALAYAIPIAALVLADLRMLHLERGGWSAASSAACMVLSALPFLGLQAVLNKGTTDSWLTTPYRSYIDRFQPNTTLGFPGDDPDDRPQTTLAQKHVYYESWVRPMVQRHRAQDVVPTLLNQRLPFTLTHSIQTVALLVFVPAGVYASLRRTLWPLTVAPPLIFLALYCFNLYYLPHYPMVIAPALVLLVMAGAQQLIMLSAGAGAASSPRGAASAGLMFVGLLGLGLSGTPEANGYFGPDNEHELASDSMNLQLRRDVRAPGVVLFRYPSATPPGSEVYNLDALDPFDAPVIRAHYLGARTAEFIRYVDTRSAGRRFYLYDLSARQLRELGDATTAAALAARDPGGPG